MRTYFFKFETSLPIPLTEAWDFFSSPLNLSKITPAKMNFKVLSDYEAESKIYEGMLIRYKVSPVFNLPMNWVTEITHIKHEEYFIDEQRFGPYAMWHHEHHFEAVKGGVLMTDLLTYAIPYGIIGQIANSILVESQVKQIFNYRETAITDLFGAYKAK